MDAPAVPGGRPALLREEVPVGVTLWDELSEIGGAVLQHVLAEAHVSGDGGVDREREGSAQGQEDAECERRSEQLHGDDDDEEWECGLSTTF